MVSPAITEAQKHIDFVYNDRIKNKAWKDLAISTSKLVEGMLSGRFVNELFQNTDDAQGKVLNCSLEGEQLIVSYLGREFINRDVEKIIGIANQEIDDKSKSTDVTGFKGIGFKALVSIASKIHILSGNYSFQFDKNHSAWKDQQMPWGLIPIWVDGHTLPHTGVQLTFKLLDSNQSQLVRNGFNEFFKNPLPILFLRHLNEVNLQVNEIHRKVEKKSAGDVTSLTSDSQLHSEWVILNWEANVDKKIRDTLPDNPTVCRASLKTAKKINMQFAFQIKDGCFSEFSKEIPQLFTTLPTKLNLGIPFLVNAEFLLNPQREQLVNTPWNCFLMRQIAYIHFFCLKNFAESKRWKTVLHGLGPAAITGVDKELKESYADGFATGKKIAWIPSFDKTAPLPVKLLSLDNYKNDLLGFISQFKDHFSADLIPHDMVHPELEEISRKLLIKSINIDVIIGKIKEALKRKFDLQFCCRVIAFLVEKGLLQKEHAIIPDNKGELKSLSQLHVLQEKMVADPPTFITINWIHDVFRTEENKDLLVKLKRLGLKELDAKELSDKIITFWELDSLNKENFIDLINYVFVLHQKEFDISRFNNLKLLNQKDEFRPAWSLYFSKDERDSENSVLDKVLTEMDQLSSRYTEINNLPIFLDFFKKLGVKDSLTVVRLQSPKADELMMSKDRILRLFIDNQFVSISGVRLGNFFYFPFMDKMSDREFAECFWKSLLKSEDFISLDKIPISTWYKGKLNKDIKISYFQWAFINHELIYGTNAQLRTANNLYSPKFSDFASDDFVCADIPVVLTSELINHFGFITEISPKKCWELLSKMKGIHPTNLDFYSLLITHLVQGWSNLKSEEKEELCAHDWFFLARNNSWQPVGQLSCFNIKDEEPGLITDCWFKTYDKLPVNTIIDLADIFSRPKITKTSLTEAHMKDPTENKKLHELIHDRFPFIAWIQRNIQGKSLESVLTEMAPALKKLKIYEVTGIQLTERDDQSVDIHVIGSSIYCRKGVSLAVVCKYIVQLLRCDRSAYKSCAGVLLLSDEEIPHWIEKSMTEEQLQDHKLELDHLYPSLADGEDRVDEEVPTNVESYKRPREEFSESSEEKNLHTSARLENSASAVSVRAAHSQGTYISNTARYGYSSWRSTAITASQPNSAVSKERLGEIGRKGEKFAFDAIRQQYVGKGYVEVSNNNGICKLERSASGSKIELKWLNFKEESFSHYDMELRKKSGEKEEYVRQIEIKATTGEVPHFFMSLDEYNVMEANTKYRLYVVTNVEKEPKIQPIRKGNGWKEELVIKSREYVLKNA